MLFSDTGSAVVELSTIVVDCVVTADVIDVVVLLGPEVFGKTLKCECRFVFIDFPVLKCLLLPLSAVEGGTVELLTTAEFVVVVNDVVESSNKK